jgi:hypothetical protein
MINKLGVEVADFHGTAISLLRRRHWYVRNGVGDFLSRNVNFISIFIVAQVLHLLKIEEAFLETQLQAFLLETMEHKTQVLEVLLEGAIVGNVAKVDRNEPV